MNDITESDLKAMEERAKAATGGPWAWERRSYGDDLKGAEGALVLDDGSAAGEYGPKITAQSPDGVFIAAARSDVPALIAEVRALRAQRERNRAAMEEAARHFAGEAIPVLEELVSKGAAGAQDALTKARAIVGGGPLPEPRRIHLGGGCEVEVCEACYQRVVAGTARGGASTRNP